METNTIVLSFVKFITILRYKPYINKLGKLVIGYNHTDGVHSGILSNQEEAEELLRKNMLYISNVLYRNFPNQLNRYRTASL